MAKKPKELPEELQRKSIGLGDGSAANASVEKKWNEMTADEKMERIYQIQEMTGRCMDRFTRDIEVLKETVRKLKVHRHADGQVVVDVRQD